MIQMLDGGVGVELIVPGFWIGPSRSSIVVSMTFQDTIDLVHCGLQEGPPDSAKNSIPTFATRGSKKR